MSAYSLPNWPPSFRSRTGNPADPCFIGNARAYASATEANQFHFNTPNSKRTEAQYRSHHKRKPVVEGEGYTFRGKNCRPRRIWLLLRDDGPADLHVLAALLKLPQSTLAKLLEPAVRAGILEASRAKPPVYSVGPVVPRGEA